MAKRRIRNGLGAAGAAAMMVLTAVPAQAADAPCVIQDMTSVYECVNEKINNPPCVIQDLTSVYECATEIVQNLLRADR